MAALLLPVALRFQKQGTEETKVVPVTCWDIVAAVPWFWHRACQSPWGKSGDEGDIAPGCCKIHGRGARRAPRDCYLSAGSRWDFTPGHVPGRAGRARDWLLLPLQPRAWAPRAVTRGAEPRPPGAKGSAGCLLALLSL